MVPGLIRWFELATDVPPRLHLGLIEPRLAWRDGELCIVGDFVADPRPIPVRQVVRSYEPTWPAGATALAIA